MTHRIACANRLNYFRQATDNRSGFAPAYGWLADSLAMLPEYERS